MFQLTPAVFKKKKKSKGKGAKKKLSAKEKKKKNEYYVKTRTGTFENKIKALVNNATQRARRKGIDFSITVADFIAITHCPILGLKLDFNKIGKGAADNSPSIDRIDPSKGYVPGNVWIISSKANAMKSNATLAELELLVVKLREKMESM